MEEFESASDHNYIQFNLVRDLGADDPSARPRGWSLGRLVAAALTGHLATSPTATTTIRPRTKQQTGWSASSHQLATPACHPEHLHPQGGSKLTGGRRNHAIAALHTEYSKTRRRYHRAARRREPPEHIQPLREAYADKRKEVQIAIRTAQAKSWSYLCSAVDTDPWGLPYSVITKRIGRNRPGIDCV